MTKVNPKLQLGLLIVAAISIASYFLGKQISQETIQAFVMDAGVWAPIIYILTHQLSYVFAPISGLPFLIAGFYLFGKTVVIYTYFVVLLGATINFWIAKKWGRPLVLKFAGRDTLEKIDKLSKEYGVITLIALRMLQGGVGDYVSYAYGLTPIKFSKYFIVTALAIIPGNIIWYYVISKTNNIEQTLGASILLAFAATLVFLGGNYWIRKHKKEKQNKEK